MRLDPMSPSASWIHRGARDGFEVVFVEQGSAGHRLVGHTTADEDGTPWSVGYDVHVDDGWVTRRVLVTSLTASGTCQVRLEQDAAGRWRVDGIERPDLDDCVDVDLESSAVTNTLPLHRLTLERGQGVDVPAAFVRADDLRVERLEQRYTLVEVTGEQLRVAYESRTFAFACELVYDRSGLVVAYPGLAERLVR